MAIRSDREHGQLKTWARRIQGAAVASGQTRPARKRHAAPARSTRPGPHGQEDVMPFRKAGRGRYKSPSGRVYTARQVRAYYATGGWRRKPRKSRRR